MLARSGKKENWDIAEELIHVKQIFIFIIREARGWRKKDNAQTVH